MNTQSRSRPAGGNALTIVLLLTALLTIGLAATLQLTTHSLRGAHARVDWNEAFFHAENGFNWAAQTIADAATGGTSPAFLGQYSAEGGALSVPYMATALAGGDSRFRNAWVTIDRTGVSTPDVYRLTVSAQVGDKVRTLRSFVHKNPPSEIFDYEYFLNNWGWWWGSSITGYGDNRANWDFDFRYNPTVNGSVLANGSISENGVPVDPLSGHVPFSGLAGSDPVSYVHAGAPRVSMPNLLDFSYYENKAIAEGGTLSVGSTLAVSGVHRDAAKPGLFLVGTEANPIVINGPVVIPGDVVIKGRVTGQGTLYVGGNLYLAGDLTYLSGPNYGTPPSSMTPAQRDQWVQDNNGRDLVGFAVRESVFGGDVNSTDWINNCYNPSGYGLRNVGNESSLGADGIAHTGDDGIAYLDTNGDGSADSAWFDADGDGAVDSAFNHARDIQMTSARASRISGYPVNSSGDPVTYSTQASNNMNRLDGLFYTNHAAAMRLARNNSIVNGSVISRDEAIIFNSTLRFVYDERVHSRYSNDPNRHIDLGLPIAGRIRVMNFEELAPVAGFASVD